MNKLTKALLITMLSATAVIGLGVGLVNSPISLSWKNKDIIGNKSNQNKEQQISIDNLNNEIEILNSDYKLLKEKYATQYQAKTELEIELAECRTVKENLEAEIIYYEEVKASLETELETSTSNNAELEMQIVNCENAISQLQSDITTYENNINTLQGQITEYESSMADIQVKMDEYDVIEERTVLIECIANGKSSLYLQNKDSYGLSFYVEEPYKENYRFMGWATVPNSINDIIDIYSYEFTENTTLYAVFEYDGYHSINYRNFTFTHETLTGYSGDEDIVVIPSSYAFERDANGNIVYEEVERVFDDGGDLYMYGCDGWPYPFTVVDADGVSHEVLTQDDIFTIRETYPFPMTTMVNQPIYCEGNEYQVKYIGSYAFENANMTEIIFPDTLEGIFSYSIQWCENLRYLHLPESLTSIGESGIAGCPSLESIILSSNLTSIGRWVDLYCMNLNQYNNGLYIPSNNNPYFMLVSVNDMNVETMKIHPDTKFIAENALSNCRQLKSIKIPNSVEYIGAMAFYYCSNLEEVILSSNLKSIEHSAFSFCTSLKIITIPASVEYMLSPFGFCDSLEQVVFEDIEHTWNVYSNPEVSVVDSYQNAINFKTNYLNSIWQKNL